MGTFRIPYVAKGIPFGNFDLGKGISFTILVKERSNFGFGDLGLKQAKVWQLRSIKHQLMAFL